METYTPPTSLAEGTSFPLIRTQTFIVALLASILLLPAGLIFLCKQVLHFPPLLTTVLAILPYLWILIFPKKFSAPFIKEAKLVFQEDQLTLLFLNSKTGTVEKERTLPLNSIRKFRVSLLSSMNIDNWLKVRFFKSDNTRTSFVLIDKTSFRTLPSAEPGSGIDLILENIRQFNSRQPDETMKIRYAPGFYTRTSGRILIYVFATLLIIYTGILLLWNKTGIRLWLNLFIFGAIYQIYNTRRRQEQSISTAIQSSCDLDNQP